MISWHKKFIIIIVVTIVLSTTLEYTLRNKQNVLERREYSHDNQRLNQERKSNIVDYASTYSSNAFLKKDNLMHNNQGVSFENNKVESKYPVSELNKTSSYERVNIERTFESEIKNNASHSANDLITVSAGSIPNLQTESSQSDNKHRLNVIFFIADDMRPEIGVYNGIDSTNPSSTRKMITPHLDHLATKSLVLKRAYVQYSLCGPSRASLLSSRRPDATRVYGNKQHWKATGANFTTIPQFFKEQGYHTVSIGKIFHSGASSGNSERAWTEIHQGISRRDIHPASNAEGLFWFAVPENESEVTPIRDQYDVSLARKVLQRIGPEAQTGRSPFFMGIGFKATHLTYVCPKKNFDQYNLEEEHFLPNATWEEVPVRSNSRLEYLISDNSSHLSSHTLREMRRAYFACVSFIDDLIGEVLQEVDQQGLTDSTVVVVTSDHGYHLGEQYHFGKNSNYELGTRVPLIVHVPGLTDHGISTKSLAESLDIFPTLVEATGFSKLPKCPLNSTFIQLCTDGESLLPLVEHPNSEVRDFAVSQDGYKYSIRTNRFRFIETVATKKQNGTVQFDWDRNTRMLFDHQNDHDEQINKAFEPNYQEHVNRLAMELHSFVAKSRYQ